MTPEELQLAKLKMQGRAVASVFFFSFVILVIGLWMGYNFIQMDKEGVSCIQNPNAWAEKFQEEKSGKDVQCYCEEVLPGSIVPLNILPSEIKVIE